MNDPWRSERVTSSIDPRREMWRSGSYEIVGDWFANASISILDGLVVDGKRLLDVATGTGVVAIEAARRGAEATGLDLTDELLDVARRRAADAGVAVEWIVGDYDEAIGADMSGREPTSSLAEPFDVIASAFGVIFAPEPAATAARLVSATRPGGTITLAAWAPDAVFDVNRTDEMKELMPPGPPPPSLSIPWATEHGVAETFADTDATLVEQRTSSVAIGFASADDAVEQFERWSGPWKKLFAYWDEVGTIVRARRALANDLTRFSDADADAASGSFTIRAAYVTSMLRR